jgi:hypothetical protein
MIAWLVKLYYQYAVAEYLRFDYRTALIGTFKGL